MADHKAFFHTVFHAYAEDFSQSESEEFAGWHEKFERRSKLVPTTLRGAFRDELCLGVYQIEARQLYIGPAPILTGCIGYVGTHPTFQRQGIASALMFDAIALAKQEGYPLLLLTGIHNFYGRFGFTNVVDYPIQIVALADLAKQPATPYTVRAATMDDSGVLLQLYQSHYNRFERSAALQEDDLRNRLPHNPPWLVCDDQNQPQGYLWLSKHDPGRAKEVAANNWPATLALLHHHADQVKVAANPPTTLRWPRPFDSPQAHEIADHLPVQWEIYCVADGEWMAHVADIPAFVRPLEALWRQRWQRSGRLWSGQITQSIADFTFTLEISGQELRLLDHAEIGAPTLHWHPSTFTKLIFGWRSVAWALNQPETQIPPELIGVAETLYPIDRVWIPPTDEF